MDSENLTRLLEIYEAAGLGGVEITSIYSVKNNEHRNRRYRSPQWIGAVQHTLQVARRLDLGVDLPAGSGWRMGGPSVTPQHANSKVVLDEALLSGGETFQRHFEKVTPQVIRAISAAGEDVDLTNQLVDGTIQWTAPEGKWTVYSLG